MIHLIYGNNRDRVLARSKEVVDKAMQANLKSLYFKFSAEGFESVKFEELIGGRSLFAEKFVVLCDGLFEGAEAPVFILKRLGEMSESGSLFIFREGMLNKKEVEIFKKASSKIEEFSTGEDKKKGYAGAREVKLRAGHESFNIFHFTDALGARDKKMAWALYHKALRAGFPAEEMFWKAVWLFRNIILVSPINSEQRDLAEKLKMSPFALSNSRKFLKNYAEEAFIFNYKKLVDIYHQFRRGNGETEIMMEQFILNL